MRRTLLLLVLVAACRGDGVPVTIDSPTPPPEPTAFETRLPRAPGPYAPSLLTMSAGGADGPQAGDLLADVDTCGSCHAEVTAQWQSSIHSFASFANPIYRANIEVFRANMGNEASQHCGCHDMPLEIDGAMKQAVFSSTPACKAQIIVRTIGFAAQHAWAGLCWASKSVGGHAASLSQVALSTSSMNRSARTTSKNLRHAGGILDLRH